MTVKEKRHGKAAFAAAFPILFKGGEFMKGGFSFCGVDIDDMGLTYAPELEDTYVYRPATPNIHEETFEGHDGGYFYGANKEPKEFILRVFFEGKVIDRGFLSKIQYFFRVGRAGKLIFKRRPWCYYYATVTNYDDTELSNYLNGIIKITMKAYYPYARYDMDELYSTRTMPYHENLMANTAIYESKQMVDALPTSFEDITKERTIILGNPGTEPAKVSITASGSSGSGVIIENKTTNQTMKLVAMDAGELENKEVHIDGLSGKTTLYDTVAKTSKLAFLYHDSGFIELAPCYPAVRNIFINYSGTNEIKTTNIIYNDYTDMYIFVRDKWYKIVEQPDKHTLKLNESVGMAGQMKTMITRMNELIIHPIDSINLSKLSFSYKPTFA